MLSIPIHKYECVHCGRHYKRKTYHDKHVLCCEFLSKNKKERDNDEEENDDTPSIRDLYLIIQDLGKKYSTMQKQMEILTQYVESKKRKLSVIDWLNKNCIPEQTYAEWLGSIKLGREHLEIIFKYDFLIGISYIFQEILPLIKEQSLPVRTFDQKNNVLFIYEKEKTWVTMTGEQLEYLINKISKQLCDQFKYWQDEHEDELCSEKFSHIYAENVKKVMGGNMHREQLYCRVKRNLYNHLKFNLKNVIQYEITF